MIIDVIGINTTPRSDSERMSPGNLPNQLNAEGKKWSIMPKARTANPMTINHLAILESPV